mmetsp:Transcript_41008/g.112815  ORF Transcript_41008/g.112815 Transcript_41008/m.112815 type:complete len:242 (+) Transcript_41008:1325-2050(+)
MACTASFGDAAVPAKRPQAHEHDAAILDGVGQSRGPRTELRLLQAGALVGVRLRFGIDLDDSTRKRNWHNVAAQPLVHGNDQTPDALSCGVGRNSAITSGRRTLCGSGVRVGRHCALHVGCTCGLHVRGLMVEYRKATFALVHRRQHDMQVGLGQIAIAEQAPVIGPWPILLADLPQRERDQVAEARRPPGTVPLTQQLLLHPPVLREDRHGLDAEQLYFGAKSGWSRGCSGGLAATPGLR